MYSSGLVNAGAQNDLILRGILRISIEVFSGCGHLRLSPLRQNWKKKYKTIANYPTSDLYLAFPKRISAMHIIWKDSADAAAYEDARVGRVFNHRRPERFPLAIVKATSEKDIISAVKLSAKHNCRVAVRSGGHSWAAWSVRDNSILIDLGNYKEVEVDAESRIAYVSPSMTGRELNTALIKDHGLMFPGGHCPDVGLGGFLLQGGMGWNCKVSRYPSISIKRMNTSKNLRIGAGPAKEFKQSMW